MNPNDRGGLRGGRDRRNRGNKGGGDLDSEWTEVKEKNAKDAVNRYYKEKKNYDFKDGYPAEQKTRSSRGGRGRGGYDNDGQY